MFSDFCLYYKVLSSILIDPIDPNSICFEFLNIKFKKLISTKMPQLRAYSRQSSPLIMDDLCSTRGTMSSSIDEKRSEPWVNLLAGGVGGLACQVIGHPFDTVKVTLFRNISDVVFIGYVLYC